MNLNTIAKLLTGATALAVALPIVAVTETVNGIKWDYSVVNGEASIDAISQSATGEVAIPSTLGGKPVTSIGDYAFFGCDGLTSVTIPSSVTSIGDSAFFGCDGLTSVTIPDGLTSIGESAFEDCSSLTSVTIPDSVMCIMEETFSGCSSLTSVKIGSGVTSIGNNAFSYSGLASVTIPDSVTSIGFNAFSECYELANVIIGNGGPSIGEGAFSSCSELTNVTIGNGATSVGDGAFMECTSLMSVTIGDGATSVGPRAFSFCEELESVTIGDGLTSIGTAAFYGCSSLRDLTLPDSVTSIGDYAFFGCTSLQEVPSIGHAGHTGDVADTIWAPTPVGLTLEGEPCVEGKHFLVAGSNATAKVVIDDYSGKWKEYDLDGAGYVTGAFRHTIEKILVLGYAAAELNDIPIPDPNSKDYLEEFSKSKAAKMFKQGATTYRKFDRTDGGFAAVTESATGLFTSPARHDVEITANVEKSDADGEAYRIVSIDVNGDKSIVVPRSLWQDKTTGCDGIFEFPFMLPTGSGRHGQYYWTAFVVYRHEWYTDTALGRVDNVVDEALNSPLGENLMTKGLEAQLFITNEMGRVFFDKYGKDAEGGGNPNWFTYWKEDGACPCLKRYEGKIVMGGTTADYGEWKSGGDKLVHLATKVRYEKLGNGVDMIGPAAFHYPEGLTFTHKTFTSKSYSFPEKGGGSVYGIYTVEEVVTHELFHEKLADIYKEKYSTDYLYVLFGRGDSDRKDEPYMWPVNIRDTGVMCQFQIKERPWCDVLCDFEEDDMFGEFALNKNDTDTYNLKTKNPAYGAYGDNEFLCMIEANKATRRTIEDGGANPSKDWAFPGEQSYCPTLPPKQDENAIANGLWRNNSTPEQPIINLIGLTSAIDRATDGLVSEICFSLEMQSSGLGELGMHATLTDRGGNPAAIAYESVGEGSSVVTFRFDGRDVYESGLTGPFRLNSITVSRFDGNDSYELATLSEFKDAEVDLRREDLARNDAYLLDVGDETVTTNGIVVSVNVEVNTAGEYGISATLVNTNGVPVASSSVSMNCTQGINRVALVFSASEILQSGIDGPYEIDNIALSKDGTRIDSRLHFYSTRKMYRSGAFDFDDDTELNPTSFMSQFADYTPPSELPQPEWFWVFFNPNGGTMSETVREVIRGEKVGTLPIPSRENNKFLGWYTELEGGAKITDSTKVTTNIMLHAHWEYDGSVVVAAAVAQGCEGMGKVSGGGKPVKSGTKVTLKATANKGYVFVGWRDAGGSVITQSASCTYVAADEDVTLTAVFATTAEDAGSLKVTVEDVPTEADGTIAFDLGACVESLSQPKLAVSGLPSGVKFDAKTGKITGKATKPGVYTVKVTATNASATGKNAVVETFNVTVPNFKWDEESVGVALEDSYRLQAGISPALSNEVAAVTAKGWKLAVSGLPSGVKFDAKKGLFSGVASKEGFYTVYFTATKGKEKQIATVTFEVVFPELRLEVAAWEDASATNNAKVAGGGKYPFGKKVTLKATAAKGNVFMGWYDDEGALVAQTASYAYVTTDEDVTFTAVFATLEEDKASIQLAVDGEELRRVEDSAPYRTNVWAGVYLEWPVAAEALSATTVKVAGLPSGLKFAAKPVTGKVGSGKTAVVVTNVPANTIYGVPTAASKIDAKNGNVKPSEVKVTVTTAGKSSQAYQIDTVVDALPSWAQGTFVGELGNWERGTGNGERETGNGGSASAEASAAALALADKQGTVSLTIAANGKVSGKAQGDGLAYTLAAPYYSGFEAVTGDEGLVSNFLADVTASWSYKEGSKTVKTNDVVRMAVQDNGICGYASVADWFEAYTVNWKIEPWKTLGKSFDKKTRTYAILSDGKFSENDGDIAATLGEAVVGRVTLKFSANGTVSVAGEFVSGYDEKKAKYTTVKASGSTTLVPVDEEHGVVFVYLTPKGLSPHSRCLDVPWPEE